MPNRILREGILDSEAVNALSFPAEVFYRRLMNVVDDFGRFDGRPSVLRSRLYPLKVDLVREADIPRWIAECEKAGLIVLYAVAGRQYILFHKLGSPRANKSKYPDPEMGNWNHPPPPDHVCAHMRADADGSAQALTSVPYSGSDSYSERPPLPPAEPGGGEVVEKTPEKPPRKAKRVKTDAELNPLFLRFWAVYPRKIAKSDAAGAFAKRAPDEDLLARMVAALAWQVRLEDWT